MEISQEPFSCQTVYPAVSCFITGSHLLSLHCPDSRKQQEQIPADECVCVHEYLSVDRLTGTGRGTPQDVGRVHQPLIL